MILKATYFPKFPVIAEGEAFALSGWSGLCLYVGLWCFGFGLFRSEPDEN